MNILIILASYNGEKYINEQISSIVNQQEVNVRIYVFDDGSKDNTASIVSSLEKEGLPVCFFENKNPTGSAANNFFQAIKQIDNIEFSQYDFIAFSDQDDIWLPNKLYEACQKLKNETSDLYMSNLILWNEQTNYKSLIIKSYPQKKYDYLFEGGSAGCTYVMTKSLIYLVKENLVKVNYLNWQFFSHDWFVYFIARVNNLKVFIDERAFILYRIHETNVHGQLNLFSFYAIKERLKLITNGWYYYQAQGYLKLLSAHSKQSKIYRLYTRNYFTRLYVLLRYNFSLIRSNKKAFQFFIVSLIPFFIKKSDV